MLIKAKATSGSKAAKAGAASNASALNQAGKTTGTSPAPPKKK